MFNSVFTGYADTIKLLRQLTQTDFAPVIEVGLGSRSFLDLLLQDGYLNLTAVEISEQALALSKERLAAYGPLVQWFCSDVLAAPLKRDYYALWHDGGAFDGLMTDEQRQTYIDLMEASMRPGGYAVIYASSTLDVLAKKLHESTLEVVQNNWDALYDFYAGLSQSTNMADKRLHVLQKTTVAN
jgi:SAM-dependent methyltransferase